MVLQGGRAAVRCTELWRGARECVHTGCGCASGVCSPGSYSPRSTGSPSCLHAPLPVAPIPLLGLSLGDEGSHPTPACPHLSPEALTPGDAQNPHDADDGGVDGQRRIDLDLLQRDAHD